MKINSNNEWDKLNEVVIGKMPNIKFSILESAFKMFYNNSENELHKYINSKYIEEHNEDIESYVSLLESNNIKVYRPDTYDKLVSIKTPNFSTQTHLTGPLNTRDLVAIFGDTILVFPPEIRSRYFETDNMKNIFYNAVKSGNKLFSLPKPQMCEEFNVYEPQLDAARCMRFNDNIIVNVTNSYNKLALKILENNFPQYTFHEVNWGDGHADGCIMPLREGVLLVNKVFLPKPKEMLPDFCKNWDVIECECHEKYIENKYAKKISNFKDINVDCNVLSINPNQIVCHDTAYKYLQSKLTKYNIECIPSQLRHSQLFDGAFHCLSLDLNRG